MISCQKAHLARFGIPEILHSNNGSQFLSHDFNQFALTYNFIHTKSSPYHPKGNGRAEAAAKVSKNMLKKSPDFPAALLNYRNTRQQGHSYSPVQHMMNHRTRTMLPTSNTLLAPVLVELSCPPRYITKEAYDQHSGAQHIEPEIGSYAYAKPPPRQRGSPWIYSKVTAHDQTRSYTLQTPHSTIRRNRVHLRPAAVATTSSCQPIIRLNHVHPASNTQAPYMAPHEPISSTISSDTVEDPAET